MRYDSEHRLNETGSTATKDRPVLIDDVGPVRSRDWCRGEGKVEVRRCHRCNEVGLPLMKRWMTIKVSVLVVGCGEGSVIRHCLPPQPPVTLDWLRQCDPQEVVAFTQRPGSLGACPGHLVLRPKDEGRQVQGPKTKGFDYFRLVLEARDVPADELLAASLRAAAAARPEPEQGEFLVAAGRELVRLLGGEPLRLEGVLRRIRIVVGRDTSGRDR